MTRISAATTVTVRLLEVYMNLKDVFFIANTGYLSFNKDHKNAIDLVDNKKPPYRLIYSLSKNEMSILRAYIERTFTNRYIETSKSLACIPLLFEVNVKTSDYF